MSSPFRSFRISRFVTVGLVIVTMLFASVALPVKAAGAPSISNLSATTIARSGRLRVNGLNFGASGQVLIGGLVAPYTRWTDALIVVYVPEATPIGTATVQVVNAGGSSNIVSITVTLRQPNGRVKWRFQADSNYIYQRPAVGPDGTIVVHDSSGFVYALTPDGGLKWIFKTRVFAGGPPSIGADGTVYVASSSTIDAIDSNGNPKWSFTEPQGGQGVIAGPTVGPDGNIYAASDFAGLGAFSLSPTGLLLWSNLGNPVISQRGQLGAEIVFGPSRAGGPVDRFYVAFDAAATDPLEHLYAFRLTGTQEWSVPLSLSKDLFMQGQQQPAVGPDGTVFETAAIPLGGNWSLNAFSPSTGSLLRSFSPSPGNGMSAPDIGADGTAYFAHSLGYLQAVSSSNALRWQFFDGSILNYPIVSPANDLVVVGGNPNFGMPGFIRGHSAANGQLLWSVNLGVENGGNQLIESRPRFTPTGNTVYFGTVILGGNAADTYCYVYALDTGGGATNQPPVAMASASPTGGQPPLAVNFSSSGSSDPNGSIVSYAWNFGDGGTSTLANPSHTYQTAGTYNATLTVTDNQGATGTASVTITVTQGGCTNKCLRSTNIALSAQLRNGTVTTTGQVTVKNETGAVVSGAKVSAKWTLPNGTTVSQTATANTSGLATFKTSSGRGTYTLTITNITKTGYTFDPAHSVLSKSITK